MAIGWRLVFAVITAACVGPFGDTPSVSAAPIRPEKDKDDGYSKKLVGTWTYKENGANRAQSNDFTLEFMSDGVLKMSIDGLGVALNGTWKTVNELGKTLTIDIEMSQERLGGGAAPQKRTLSVVFEDRDTVVISAVGEKEDPRTLKRKP